MDEVKTRYARCDDVHVAYQVWGESGQDLVLLLGSLVPIEAIPEEPSFDRFVRRLATFSRLVLFDRRGVGASDRSASGHAPTLEQWMDDMQCVLAAVGSESCALLGYDSGGLLAALHAATHPEQVTALILANSFGTLPAREPPSAAADDFLDNVFDRWGEEVDVSLFAPSKANDPAFKEWLLRAWRRGASPSVAKELFLAAARADIREVLPSISVPTLVLHRQNDVLIPAEHGRFLAQQIPGARLIELPGADHVPYLGDSDSILDEIEEFLTGARPAPESDRVLATVVFTDIVSSTERAAELGDRRWSELLDDHDAIVLRELDRHRGREVKTTGDGVLATFDGPARAVRCASAIRDAVRRLGLEVRCGVHTGEIELRGDDVAGIAVVIAQRVCQAADRGEVLVSRTVTDLVAGSGISFVDRGSQELKGVPGPWSLYAVG